jgi:hypothetical protein
MSDSEGSLNVFLNGFSARDIAEPLRSFDETAVPSTLRAAMESQQLEIVGIRKSGVMAGWLARSDVNNGAQLSSCRPFDEASVIADSDSLNTVVRKLSPESCLFLRTFGEVSGVIRISDFQKAPMRMWLFGLVTITELRVTRMIDEVCPRGSWQQYLSQGRLQIAASLQEERRRRHQQPSLLECLQLSDKGKIVARDDNLRRLTRFSSRRAVEAFVKGLQDLRNNLAHAHDITGDWAAIRDLAANIHRIVLGPAAVDGAASAVTTDNSMSALPVAEEE